MAGHWGAEVLTTNRLQRMETYQNLKDHRDGWLAVSSKESASYSSIGAAVVYSSGRVEVRISTTRPRRVRVCVAHERVSANSDLTRFGMCS